MSDPKFQILLYQVALLIGGAALFIACGRKPLVEPPDMETLITMQSTDLTVINSTNGKLTYRFETPLLERYELASEPYMEYRKGVRIVSYNDSTHLQESELVADYAKYIEPQQLWEARGNVVATSADGKVLETEQLFWDEKSDRIYSNVESKMTDAGDVTIGDGFETDSKFKDYRIRNPRGRLTVDTEPRRDSTAVESPSDSLSAAEPATETNPRSSGRRPESDPRVLQPSPEPVPAQPISRESREAPVERILEPEAQNVRPDR